MKEKDRAVSVATCNQVIALGLSMGLGYHTAGGYGVLVAAIVFYLAALSEELYQRAKFEASEATPPASPHTVKESK